MTGLVCDSAASADLYCAVLLTQVVTPEALLTEDAADWPAQLLLMYMLEVGIVDQPEK